MMNARKNDLTDRRAAASEAKSALLKSFRTARIAAEPARLAKQAERMAVTAARQERRLERERLKRVEVERRIAEACERQAAADAAARAETDLRETAEKHRIARVIEDEAARKAERDRRYANRKARCA